jgi:hypothetical protein
MGDKRQKNQSKQLLLAFMAEGQGEALSADHEGTEPPTAKQAPQSPAVEESLMEEVCQRKNLERAWQRVRANKGSPGVDVRTIAETPDLPMGDYSRGRPSTLGRHRLDHRTHPSPKLRGGAGVGRSAIAWQSCINL